MAPRTLYQLGDFQFNLANGSPEEVARDLQWRWPMQERILRKPALQFLGPSADRITLDGVLYPGNQPGSTGGQGTIDKLRGMADKGEPVMFTDGLGRVYGRFAILNIQEKRQVLMDTGAARKIEFQVTILEYGEDDEKAKPSAERTGNPTFISQVLGNARTVNFTGDGSGFNLTDWTNLPDFQLDLSTLGAAGFSIPQAAAVAQVVGAPEQVKPSLDTFGAGGALTEEQRSGWTAAGINPTELLGAMAAGRGAPAAAVGLDALRVAPAGVLGSVGGGALGGLSSMVQHAATLTGLFNVDPKVTSSVGSVLRLD